MPPAAAPPGPQPPRTIDLLLDGLAAGSPRATSPRVPPLRRALEAVRDQDGAATDELRWLWLACRIASELWDDETWDDLATRQVRIAREAGALAVLPLALTYRAGTHVHAGDFAGADAADRGGGRDHEIDRRRAAHVLRPSCSPPGGAARPRPLRLIEVGIRDATPRGEGRGLSWGDYATALLRNGLGDYDAALAAARRRVRARRPRPRRLGDGRADRGGRPQRPPRRRRPPPSNGWRSGPGPPARTGRSGSRRALEPC